MPRQAEKVVGFILRFMWNGSTIIDGGGMARNAMFALPPVTVIRKGKKIIKKVTVLKRKKKD